MHAHREKSHLADVDVGAVGVDLRVVGHEHGGVDAVRGDDLVAGIAALDDVGRLAVLALVAQADALAGLEVVAGAVDLGVRHRELVAKPCGLAHDQSVAGRRVTYVETLWLAEMLSQMSPSWMV